MAERIEHEEGSGGEPFEQLLDYLTAQRFFLSIAETRAAKALLKEGFDFVEVAAFLQNSASGAFYRRCLTEHYLPEMPCILAALREAFDLRLSPKVASERAMEALRRHLQMEEEPEVRPKSEPIQHNAETIALEIELFGVDVLRHEHWPAWMLDLVNAPHKGSPSDRRKGMPPSA